MKKVFYLITSKEVINKEGQQDLGTDFKKIELSTESEDFFEFKETFYSEFSDEEYVWGHYIDFFVSHFKDELNREKDESTNKKLWIYESIVLTENQYRMLFHQMSGVHLHRDVSVMDFKLPIHF